MNNDEVVLMIMSMNKDQLFEFVMLRPEFLCDSYYRVFGNAIQKRYDTLTPPKEQPCTPKL